MSSSSFEDFRCLQFPTLDILFRGGAEPEDESSPTRGNDVVGLVITDNSDQSSMDLPQLDKDLP